MPNDVSAQLLQTAHDNTMLAQGAWLGVQQDRALQGSLLHFQATQLSDQLGRMNQLDAMAAFSSLKEKAARIGGGIGESTVRDIGVMQSHYAAGATKQSGILLDSLVAKSGVATASLLATGDHAAWDLLNKAREKPPAAPCSFDQLRQGWNTAHPSAPWTSLKPANVTPTLTQLLAVTGGDGMEKTEISNWALFQADPALYSVVPHPDPVQLMDTLGLRKKQVNGREIARTALAQRGKPYVWGGESLREGGFDCSGLVQWSYARHGINVPRTTWQQIQTGTNVGWDGLRVGDAVFFDMNGGQRDANHVGIYTGNGAMVAAPKPHDVIKTYRLDSFWRSRFVGARRYI